MLGFEQVLVLTVYSPYVYLLPLSCLNFSFPICCTFWLCSHIVLLSAVLSGNIMSLSSSQMEVQAPISYLDDEISITSPFDSPKTSGVDVTRLKNISPADRFEKLQQQVREIIEKHDICVEFSAVSSTSAGSSYARVLEKSSASTCGTLEMDSPEAEIDEVDELILAASRAETDDSSSGSIQSPISASLSTMLIDLYDFFLRIH